MKCARCGIENDADAVFCENCGEELALACAVCGSALKLGVRYCKKCGAVVEILTSAQAVRLAVLRQSAPLGLQEKILAARDPMEGERKPVSILFTDIVGSTALAETLDPEEYKEIVNGAHRRVSEAVYRYEGIIAQLLGDGVLAFFGAPITHEDDPIRAVRAGLDIQDAMQEYARELSGYVDNFQMRAGIHTGTVVVGQVGSNLHMEYLAIGDAVNLAARLQSAAQPGKVLISEATARLVKAGFDLTDLGEIRLKGKNEPVQVYEVEEQKSAPGSGRGIEGLSAPLVGREAELGALRQALEKVAGGQGQIVSILGEAGIGKTRLVEEARQGSSLRWLEGRALSYGQALPFWALIQLVKNDLGLSDGDPEVRVLAALRRRVNRLFGERAGEVLPYLAHWIGVRLSGELDERVHGLDGETLKRQALMSIVEYFKRAALEQPTVLVFEDLQWADPSTLVGLEKLMALADRAPLMLLLLARTEREHGSWKAKIRAESEYAHRFTQIELNPLTKVDTRQLVARLLEEAMLPEELQRLILERAEGNPFYLEEILRSLIEQGVLVCEEHTWKAGAEIERVEIPETLEGVLLARIDRLEENVRRTLQLAAVIGRTFLYRLLEAISTAEEQLDEDLAQLQRVDLVREKARKPELEYMFKHALTQEAAYNSLLLERRADYHRRVGETLEQLFVDRQAEFYGLLAYHFDSAGDSERAIGYWIKAGDKARIEDALDEAIRSYQRALELLQEMGENAVARKTWLKLGLCFHTNSEFEKAHLANKAAFALESQVHTASTLAQASIEEEKPLRWLRFSTWSYPYSGMIDPAKVGIAEDVWVCTQLFAGLAEFDAETNVVPHAARSWEVLDGGKRYLFHLRDDVRWTDGTPVTAADYEWSWKRCLAPGMASYSGFLDNVIGARDFREGRISDPEQVGVRALDGLTLEVRLAAPAAFFIYLLTLPFTRAVPRRVVERWGEEWFRPEHILTNGPFRMMEFEANHTLLGRNPDYFGEYRGNLDRYECKRLESKEAVFRDYQAGHTDYFDGSLKEFETWKLTDEVKKIEVMGTTYLFLNPTRPALRDVRVRRAIAHALDRNRWAETTNPTRRPWPGGGIVPLGMSGYSPDLGLRFDLERAQQLLAEAGFLKGENLLPLKFPLTRDSSALGEEIKSHLYDQLGIHFTTETLPLEIITGKLFSDFDVALLGWDADYPDPDNFLRLPTLYPHLLKMGWRHPRFEQLVETAARTLDRVSRLAMYREADRILVNEEVVVIPIFYNSGVLNAFKPWVKGIEPNALGQWQLKDVRIEDH